MICKSELVPDDGNLIFVDTLDLSRALTSDLHG
jgi:hypothetical protein